MYKVKRKTTMPAALKGQFSSYEDARNQIRKYLREKGKDRALAANGFSIVKM